jgi:hypothetical protein
MNISLSSDNDIQIIDAGLPLVTGIEEIRQLCGQILRSFQGDWFLDLDKGMPYFQTLLVKATTISGIEAIYLDVIGRIPGILDIRTFKLSFDVPNRIMNITFTAQTSDGVLDFNLEE